MIANGAYIGLGSFDRVGDAGDILRHGSPIWLLWGFGGFSMLCGFRLWHGLGPHFGFGESGGRVDARAAYASLLLLCLSATVAMILSPRS